LANVFSLKRRRRRGGRGRRRRIHMEERIIPSTRRKGLLIRWTIILKTHH
jgi:hypothetical protein